jgi:serine/threonine-protein kinase
MGKYTPIARLGDGGMADVFLAIARGPMGFNKLAVVKRLKHSEDASHVRMFLDEARLTARLNHPNIVHTYEVGEVHGKFFIAMEYLEGQSLRQLTRALAEKHEGLSDPMIAFVASHVLKGLHHAHELCDFDGTPLGVVHRDVSPQNLFVTYTGEVKLLDFGIAKAAVNSTHTDTGVLKGKVRYMAPEQVAGVAVDRRLDVFSFGVVMWELLARRLLYQGETASILNRIMSHEVPTVRSARPEASPELEAIVMKAVRLEPGDRYATADAMRVELEHFLRGHDLGTLERELVQEMNKLFAKTRDEVRARVKSFLARAVAAGEETAPSATLMSSGELPLLLQGGPVSSTPSGTESIVSSPPTASALKPLVRRRPFLVLSLGAAAVAALAGGVVVLTRGNASSGASPPPAAAAASARVRVETVPPGALIEWNGHPLDRSPASVTIDPGPQTLILSLDGYEPASLVVDAKAGDTITRVQELTRKPAGAAGASPPSATTAVPPPQPLTHMPRVSWASARAPAAPPPSAAVTATSPPPTAATASARPRIKVLDDSESP